jgi:hypothetical protein
MLDWLLLHQPLRYTPQLTCCDGDQYAPAGPSAQPLTCGVELAYNAAALRNTMQLAVAMGTVHMPADAVRFQLRYCCVFPLQLSASTMVCENAIVCLCSLRSGGLL